EVVAEPLPIGKAIGGTRVYAVDRAGEPVPVRVAGELLIGGEGLARGYLNRPDQTAGRFVPDPLSGGAGGWLYRHGDRVRYRSDGGLEFLGRIDRQVKYRGYRIELGGIEQRLRALPGVAEALVRVLRRGEARLVAYLRAAEEAVG